jgi:hypothetical protein
MENHLSQEIKEIPDLLDEIKTNVLNEQLAVFIGAGVSRLVGCDGWGELANSLLDECYEKKLINFKEKQVLKYRHTGDHKKLITICYYLFKNKHLEDCFYKKMEQSLLYGNEINGNEIKPKKNIYEELYKLRGLFVTTNADTHFDKLFFKENVIYEKEKFKDTPIEKTNLYHIHGSITCRESLVFTVSEYLNRYKSKGHLSKFLSNIFENYTVLFVGYGLGEFEMLDFLLRPKDNKENTKNHFSLSPFFKGEDNIYKAEQAYYNELGVTLLPYEIDQGHNQLTEVINDWNRKINLETIFLPKTLEDIKSAIDNFHSKQINPTLQKIKNDKSLESFFFVHLRKSNQALEWLDPLKDKGYFSPKENPGRIENQDKTYYFPFWTALRIIYPICKKINQEKDSKKKKAQFDKVYSNVYSIVDAIIKFQRGKGLIDNPETDAEIINILSEIPIIYIKPDDYTEYAEYIKDCFKKHSYYYSLKESVCEKFLPYLIKNKSKDFILNILEIIFHSNEPNQIKKNSIKKISGIMEEYYLKEIISNNKDDIATICAKEAADIVLKIIEGILIIDPTLFDVAWIPTIEDHEQKEFPDKYQCQLIYFTRIMLEKSDPNKIKPTVTNLLKSNYEIFRRLAFHLINYHYQELNSIFWKLTENPLGKTYIHELYELLKNNASNLTEDHMEKVLNWIKNYDVPLSESENEKEFRDNINAYYKKEWLSALLKSNNQTVKSLYKEYDEINDASLDHPGFHYFSSIVKVGFVKNVSPIDKELFFEKSNSDKVAYINSYDDIDDKFVDNNFEETSLSNAIKEFVVDRPKEFTKDLDSFLDIKKMKYQTEIIRGFQQAWENKTELEWKKIFNFITMLISSNGFWDTQNEQQPCIKAISNLIIQGTKDDSHAFLPDYLKDAEEIIKNLFLNYKEENTEFMKSDSQVKNDDPGSFIVSSGIGCLLLASVELSLRYARVQKTDSKERWLTSIKKIFDDRLNEPSQASSTSIVITMEFKCIRYLDSPWLEKNFDKIFNLENDFQWELAMSSFLKYSNLEKFACNKLTQGDHYRKALNYNGNNSIRKKVVNHIVFGYLYFEELDSIDNKSKLIRSLITNGSLEQLSELIEFILISKKEFQEHNKKIKVLWERIIERIKDKEEKFKDILNRIILWLSLFDFLDDDLLKYAKKSAPYLKNNLDVSLYKNLHRLASKSAKNTAELFLEITKKGNYCDYNKKRIEETISILYEAGQYENCIIICNYYLENGYLFISDIYSKFAR